MVAPEFSTDLKEKKNSNVCIYVHTKKFRSMYTKT